MNQLPIDPQSKSKWQAPIDAWLAHYRAKSPHTHDAYQRAARRFFEWAKWYTGQPLDPGEITPALATDYALWLRAEGKAIKRDPDTGGRAPWERDDFDPQTAPAWIRWKTTDHIILRRNGHGRQAIVELRGELATASVNVHLAAMYSLIDWITARYDLWPANRVNPFDASVIERQANPRQRATYPTIQEIRRLLATINRECVTGARDFALILGFTQTCLRYSEFIGLRWSDIDHSPLPDGPNAGDYVYRHPVAKKRREEQATDILTAGVYNAICHYLRLAGRPAPDPDEYIWLPLFPERIQYIHPEADQEELERMAHTPISNSTINAMLSRRARAAGIDPGRCHVHALRHAGARIRYGLMARHGNVDPLALQSVLHHQNLNTTMRYISKDLETPSDPGGRQVTRELLSD